MRASPKDETGPRPTLVEDRRRSLDDRRVAEDHLRLFIDTTPALLHSALPDGNLDFFNKRWLQYLGLPLDDIRGWRWTNTIHPEDVEEFVHKWRSSLATGKPFEAEARVRRADGEYRAFLHRKVPLRNDQGSITKWYGSSVDIEERKRSEEELRRSEFYLAEGERLAHSGSWAFNPSGFFDHWSQELFQIYGLDPAQGAPTLEDNLRLVHPYDREFMARTMDNMLAEASGCDVKKRIVRPDGELRHIRFVGVPVVEHGILKRIIGTAVDITEQEQMTQKLRRREAYLAEAQRLSHTGSFGWNVSSGELFWSEESFRIFGYDHRATKPTVELALQRVHPDDRPHVQEVIDRASNDGENFDIKYRLRMPDGVVKHLEVIAHAMKDDLGNAEFVGAVTDITEQHEARAALESAIEEIKTLKDQLYKENLALKEEIDHRLFGSAAASTGARVQGGTNRFDGAYHGRDGHWEGISRTCDS